MTQPAHQLGQCRTRLRRAAVAQVVESQIRPVRRVAGFVELVQRRGGQVPAVRFDDYLPRRLLGEYLQWAAPVLLGRAPDRLTVRHLATVAHEVSPNGTGATVTTADGTKHQVDLAIVTTGHGLSDPTPTAGDDLIAAPYPLPDTVDRIPAGATVALLVTGLTAMDVIAALTVGDRKSVV